MNETADLDADLRTLAGESRAWPFIEARELAERVRSAPPAKGYVLFETGYGPSGLPHIGTFGEVARTTMVRRAFSLLSDVPTKLFAFSDDMDGLRKVPDNVPEQEMLRAHLGQPLTDIPDPFGTHSSFGAHNNARLRAFLDRFGFEYEFVSATDCYRSGRLDEALLLALRHYDDITRIILPTLGSERRATYSPFLPVSTRSGRVLQVPVVHHDADAGTIVYEEEDGTRVETPVTGGRCKLQWKADWAMRWVALGVDYEMAGKDLIDSVRLSSRICQAMGGRPPQSFIYELFLDDRGEKISKSKGNGLAVDDWLMYAPAESLSLFMFQKPKTAKRLHFGVIPKTTDEWLDLLRRYPSQKPAVQLDNPVWHIHGGEPPRAGPEVSFTALLNLVGVCHSENAETIWHFVSRCWPDVTPVTAPIMARLIEHAIAYYRDFVKPQQNYRHPTPDESAALADLARELSAAPDGADAETLQTLVYEVGKRHACFIDLKAWFQALYQILLGQSEGPRMGSFIALYGRSETIALIDRARSGQDLAAVTADS
ncbi:MAG: lysine--tRNA ligase [Rhodospirillales bacterium]|nr:lysine--tRNA ligase [Rhodospirillales bacterium]